MTRQFLLLFFCLRALSQTSPPEEDEQKTIVEEARAIALRYSEALPNFTCDQETDRYVNPHGDKSTADWRRLDRFTARLSYNGVAEDYKIVAINGRPVENRTMESLGGTLSRGDFATALRLVFTPSSETKFEWHTWGSVRGHICYLFKYSVAREHSRWTITAGKAGNTYRTAYDGVVSIDQETKRVLKLTVNAVGIPASFPIQLTQEVLDYDWAQIGGRNYLLPFSFEVRLNAGSEFTRNVARYENYRKFSSDANITFH